MNEKNINLSINASILTKVFSIPPELVKYVTFIFTEDEMEIVILSKKWTARWNITVEAFSVYRIERRTVVTVLYHEMKSVFGKMSANGSVMIQLHADGLKVEIFNLAYEHGLSMTEHIPYIDGPTLGERFDLPTIFRMRRRALAEALRMLGPTHIVSFHLLQNSVRLGVSRNEVVVDNVETKGKGLFWLERSPLDVIMGVFDPEMKYEYVTFRKRSHFVTMETKVGLLFTYVEFRVDVEL